MVMTQPALPWTMKKQGVYGKVLTLGIGVFVVLCGLFWFGLVQGTTDVRDPLWFRGLCAVSAGSFATTAMMDLLRSAIEWATENEGGVFYSAARCSAQRAAVGIHCLAAVTHGSIALDLLPIIVTKRGRRYHTVRLAEWIALIPIMMTLLHSYDPVPKSRTHLALVTF